MRYYKETRELLIEILEPGAMKDGPHENPPSDQEIAGFIRSLPKKQQILVAAAMFVGLHGFLIPEDFYDEPDMTEVAGQVH